MLSDNALTDIKRLSCCFIENDQLWIIRCTFGEWQMINHILSILGGNK